MAREYEISRRSPVTTTMVAVMPGVKARSPASTRMPLRSGRTRTALERLPVSGLARACGADAGHPAAHDPVALGGERVELDVRALAGTPEADVR